MGVNALLSQLNGIEESKILSESQGPTEDVTVSANLISSRRRSSLIVSKD